MTYQVGAHFEALDEGVLLVPFDPRYTQVGFNIASVQVRKGHHSSSSAENKPITNLAIDVLLGCSVNVLLMKTEGKSSIHLCGGAFNFKRFCDGPSFLPLPRRYLAPFFGAFFSSGFPLSLPEKDKELMRN